MNKTTKNNDRNYLNDSEVKELMDLFDKIKLDLSDDSFPTRTNRLEAVENMKKVLEIHNYTVEENKVPTLSDDHAEPNDSAESRMLENMRLEGFIR
jgi:hypothetical protein